MAEGPARVEATAAPDVGASARLRTRSCSGGAPQRACVCWLLSAALVGGEESLVVDEREIGSRVKNGIIGVIRGTGEITQAAVETVASTVRTAVTEGGETGAAAGNLAVGAVKGAIDAVGDVGGQAPRPRPTRWRRPWIPRAANCAARNGLPSDAGRLVAIACGPASRGHSAARIDGDAKQRQSLRPAARRSAAPWSVEAGAFDRPRPGVRRRPGRRRCRSRPHRTPGGSFRGAC